MDEAHRIERSASQNLADACGAVEVFCCSYYDFYRCILHSHQFVSLPIYATARSSGNILQVNSHRMTRFPLVEKLVEFR